MDRLRVLLVTQNYLPCVGGVEIHAQQVAHELSRRGHDVAIVGMNFATAKLPPRLQVLANSVLAPAFASYDDDGIAVHSLAPGLLDRLRMLPIAVRAAPGLRRVAYHALNRFGYPFYRWVYLPRMRKLVRGCEVVHSLAGGYLGWTAQAAARELGVPFVCTPFVHPGQWGDGLEDVEYYRRADAVVGLVETDRQYLASIGVPEKKLHVIGVSPSLPATADPDAFRARRGLVGKPVVLYVGRMMAQKGATAVLASAAAVWERVPEARFVFIGPATAEEAKAFEGADPRICYLGRVSPQEKADALAACDVFCMPSMSEILPTVYLEAWSYGKPVVGGLAHGLPDLVEGNGGGIAAAQERDRVAAALVKLLEDRSLATQMGSRGRELVRAKYSVPAVTEALLELYRHAARGHEPGTLGSAESRANSAGLELGRMKCQ